MLCSVWIIIVPSICGLVSELDMVTWSSHHRKMHLFVKSPTSGKMGHWLWAYITKGNSKGLWWATSCDILEGRPPGLMVRGYGY